MMISIDRGCGGNVFMLFCPELKRIEKIFIIERPVARNDSRVSLDDFDVIDR